MTKIMHLYEIVQVFEFRSFLFCFSYYRTLFGFIFVV
jgi:hypothetical protein